MKIGFLGAGNIAEAIIRGILRAKKFSFNDILISDIRKERLDYLSKTCNVTVSPDNISLINESDIIVIAVKPKDIDGVLADLKNVEDNVLVISIVAAISTKYIEEGIGKEIAVIRVMPNTPALICDGVSAITKGTYAKISDINTAIEILKSVGVTQEVDETLMDVVTAVSGSGPAYVFLFMEALVDAAIMNGLSDTMARTLAFQTVSGAAKMVIETKEDPRILREKVTSPGGTTIEALKVLELKGFKAAIQQAVLAAIKRSKELTK